ncbi:glucokinase [Candidatus Desulfofervidus auxilii]|uniref:Glucokinase n=1 Tax=Desulfofervidus auxilii TaxID=1621989 RepID=A0A7V1I4Z9_DESA2|nr:ROK family protein [Candidatus Desulfofervidus auxilii]AMM41884.1 glucokinase [Candidatus Desulfofervidus auxilii]HEB74552.1 ROK family protein [Candidatus Desulfofervidus auxilii]
MKGLIGFDIGGTNLRCGLISEEGKIIAFYTQPTGAQRGVEKLIQEIISQVKRIEKEHSEIPIAGIGIGIAGILKPIQGIVCFSPNLPGWRQIPLLKMLRQSIPYPIFIENDANLIALGEAWQGAGRGEKNFFLLTLGTGIGGGIIYQGHLWSGETSAAEIGHIKIDPYGERCLCGRRGCLETFASASWLVRRAYKHMHLGMPSILAKYPKITAKDVFTAAQRGDILACYLFQLAGWALGIGIATLCNTLGFKTVIIGGGMSNAWEEFIGSLKGTLTKELLAIDYSEVKIIKSSLGDMAGIYGACYLVKQNLD